MEKSFNQVKKKKVNWRDVLFSAHRKDLSEVFELAKVNKPHISTNRLAYYVLKANYSTTFVQFLRFLVRDQGVPAVGVFQYIKTTMAASYL